MHHSSRGAALRRIGTEAVDPRARHPLVARYARIIKEANIKAE